MSGTDNTETDNTEMEAALREEYAAFISQIELRHIWLVQATIQNNAGPDGSVGGTLHVEDDPTWHPIDRGFRAMSNYQVRVISEDGAPASEITVTFAVDFDSSVPMTDPLFTLFGPINLPLNTWPYLREFIYTNFGRMNWLPFAIPALKRGLLPAKEGDSSAEANPSTPEPAEEKTPLEEGDSTGK